MNFKEIEQLTRREIIDESGPDRIRRVKSWQILAYANEAEEEACIRARLLVDSSTSAICAIQITSGTAVYNYDPRIVLILRGKMTGGAQPLKRVSYTLLDERFAGWEDQTGEVEAFVTGMDKGKVRLFRKPSAIGVLNLTAVRTPLQPMTTDTDSPEIPERLHPALVYWIKHKIYNNQDSELFDKNRADVHLQMFEQKFGQRTADPYDVFDAMHIPQYTPSSCDLEHDPDSNYF